MSSKVKPARAASKKRPGQLAGRSRPTGRSISPAMREFKRLFPQQTAVELVLRTGADIRHCERCVSGRRELGPRYQQKLLQSDVGREILIALMGEAKPKWWVGFRRHLALAELVRNQARTAASIEAMQREFAAP